MTKIIKMTKHYLNDDGTRWYVQINNKSEELIILYDEAQTVEIQNSKFPYYVVWDEDTGIEAVYPTLGELKENEQ